MTPTEIMQLSLDNDHAFHIYWQGVAREKLEQSSDNEHWNDEEWRKFSLADELEAHFTRRLRTLTTCSVEILQNNLLQHAVAEIDWQDLADSILTTAREALALDES